MSFEILDTHQKLQIRLENGIYEIYPDSGTGKTYLYNYLRELPMNKYSVYALTYADFNITKNIQIPLDRKVYFFDRYDMYNGKFVEEIEYLRDKAIILVDVKTYMKYLTGYVDVCVLQFTENMFEVF